MPRQVLEPPDRAVNLIEQSNQATRKVYHSLAGLAREEVKTSKNMTGGCT